jgi:hypothetical protein
MDLMRTLRLALWFAGFAATTAGGYYAMDQFDHGVEEDPKGYSQTSTAFAAKEAIGAAEEYRERSETAAQTGDYAAYSEPSSFD